MPTKVAPNLISWASQIEQNTIDQAAVTARHPVVAGHVALMPDAHHGYGSTVGSVIPTQSAIIPSAIGVDIGCGMIAVETDIPADALPDNLDGLHKLIEMAVPAGVGQGHAYRNPGWLDRLPPGTNVSAKQIATINNQFGTLGAGNHFVEVCLDSSEMVWVVLHSGSRGIGNQLAIQHILEAKQLMKSYFINLEDPDLAYFVQGTIEFDRYIKDMLWAQDYARLNREKMMDAVLRCVFSMYPDGIDVNEVRRINCHHNFTEQEHHHGRDLWITRKGAIRARVGDYGVIPGSMGTATYIVEGLGNPASYTSCSHGAGRRMSRTAARQNLDADGMRAAMKDKAWNADSPLDNKRGSLLEEDPRAYKDIDQVMRDQADLVRVTHKLHQVLNFKGQ